MSSPHETRLRSRDEAIRKVLPIASRAVIADTETRLYASAGGDITPALRDELLAKCKAGEYVELHVDLIAYEQKAGVANRKFVRFRDGAMMRLGSSGRGRPFLRDHEQGDSLARAVRN